MLDSKRRPCSPRVNGEAIALKPLIFIAAAAVLLAALPAEAKRGKLPPYPKALRCAALTNASMRQSEALNDDSIGKFDHALFWGLAAADSARKAKISAPSFEAALEKASVEARAQLGGGDSSAGAELAKCVREVPPLKKKK